MDIRQISKIDVNYYKINREERNYAAIFFAALCKPGNLERFLKDAFGCLDMGEMPGFAVEMVRNVTKKH